MYDDLELPKHQEAYFKWFSHDNVHFHSITHKDELE